MQCKVYKFQLRRSGQCLFWEVGRIAAKMEFSVGDKDKGWYRKRKDRWLQLLGNYGIPHGHLVNAHTSSAAAAGGDLSLHRPAWSTHATILIVASWGAFMARLGDRAKGASLLKSLVAMHASSCSTFCLTPSFMPEPGQRTGTHAVAM